MIWERAWTLANEGGESCYDLILTLNRACPSIVFRDMVCRPSRGCDHHGSAGLAGRSKWEEEKGGYVDKTGVLSGGEIRGKSAGRTPHDPGEMHQIGDQKRKRIQVAVMRRYLVFRGYQRSCALMFCSKRNEDYREHAQCIKKQAP
jgi:hypothetical protein